MHIFLSLSLSYAIPIVSTLLKSYTIALMQSSPATRENYLDFGLGSAVHLCGGTTQPTNEIFNISHVVIIKCFRPLLGICNKQKQKQKLESSLKALQVHLWMERQMLAGATLRMIVKLRATSILCACNELSSLQLFCLAFDAKVSAKSACD